MVSRRLIAMLMGSMWVWLTGYAMANESASILPLPEQMVTARTSGELMQALQPWVTAHLRTQVGLVQVEPLGEWRWPVKRISADRWRVTWEPAVARQHDWLVSLRAMPEQADGKVVEVRFLAREQQVVWRVLMPVRKGDAIDCEALRQDIRVHRSGRVAWQGDCAALSGLVARRPLSVNEVLLDGDLGPKPAVEREQAVQIWTRSQGIVIQARGQALADASVGQRVPVRIAGHDGVLQATVMAPGELQIMEGAQ